MNIQKRIMFVMWIALIMTSLVGNAHAFGPIRFAPLRDTVLRSVGIPTGIQGTGQILRNTPRIAASVLSGPVGTALGIPPEARANIALIGRVNPPEAPNAETNEPATGEAATEYVPNEQETREALAQIEAARSRTIAHLNRIARQATPAATVAPPATPPTVTVAPPATPPTVTVTPLATPPAAAVAPPATPPAAAVAPPATPPAAASVVADEPPATHPVNGEAERNPNN